jgi:hypothetical protein
MPAKFSVPTPLPTNPAGAAGKSTGKQSQPAAGRGNQKSDIKNAQKMVRRMDLDGAAAAEAIQPEDHFISAGRDLLAEMDKLTKQTLLDITGKPEAELWYSIGYLHHLKTAPCDLGDKGLQPGNSENITIEFLQSGATQDFVAEILQQIDSEYEHQYIIEHSFLRGQNQRAGSNTLAPWKSMRFSDFIPTEKFLKVIYGESHCPSAAKNWFFRRDLYKMDELGAELPNSPALAILLQTASLLQLTRPQAEIMIRDALNQHFKNTSLHNTIIAVKLEDLKWPKMGASGNSLSRSSPFTVDYSELVKPVKVYFCNRHSVLSVQALSEPIILTLGNGPGAAALSVETALTPILSRRQREATWDRWEQIANEQALSAAKATPEIQKVIVVKGQLNVKYTDEYKARKAKLSLADLRTAIADALGGVVRGIHSALISTDERYFPRFDNGVSFRILERSNTVWANTLVHRLSSDETQYLRGNVFASIRLRGAAQVVNLSEAESAEEAGMELSSGDIMGELEDHLHRTGPLFLPCTTADGEQLVWEATPRTPLTPLSQILTPANRVLSIAGVEYRDLRTIFTKKITAANLFPVLLQMKDRELFMYTGTEGVADFQFVEIYHPHSDPYRASEAGIMVADS